MVTAVLKLKTLAPWKESYNKPRQHIKKQRHHFTPKIYIVKTMVFPVVTYRCESWIIKKAECQIIDAFELCCWRRLLRVPWTARRSNQSVLKKINSEYSLEGLMLQLELQYFGHLIWSVDSLEKTLILGKAEGRRRWEQWRMRWLDKASPTQWTLSEQTPGDGEGQGSLACFSPCSCKESDMT